MRLSGGQKQRLSIARLLLKKPDVVILDEAMAHLDPGAELNIWANRTCLIVTHRILRSAKAGRIVFMEAGRVVANGGHAELLQHVPRYQLCDRSLSLADVAGTAQP